MAPALFFITKRKRRTACSGHPLLSLFLSGIHILDAASRFLSRTVSSFRGQKTTVLHWSLFVGTVRFKVVGVPLKRTDPCKHL